MYRPSALSFGAEFEPLAESDARPGATRSTSSIWPAWAAGRAADSRTARRERNIVVRLEAMRGIRGMEVLLSTRHTHCRGSAAR